jgi:hypothetical protein
MSDYRKHIIEFGDFQTPDNLARSVCAKLSELGVVPDMVIEPTCGIGAFVLAAAEAFPEANAIRGYEINGGYLDTLRQRLPEASNAGRIRLSQADFFATDWKPELRVVPGRILVLGNFPWVTNSAQGAIGGRNLPEKSNFQNHSGLDAITGKANFDISEWMLLEVVRWFRERAGDIAMLVKTSVARKVLAHAERQKLTLREASLYSIDAKKTFDASVDACLLVMRFAGKPEAGVYDYSVYPSLASTDSRRVGQRRGFTVNDLDAFESSSFLLGEAPQKWRSGIKHDAAPVMELSRVPQGWINGLGECVDIEPDYLFPLLKGSDIGGGKAWREKFVLVTQRYVGEPTEGIRASCPKTWAYLEAHAALLDGRGSSIYRNNPRFSIFGVGGYAFRPWRIAVCSLYKALKFRVVGPIEGKPAMFDDTVYYVSFDTETEARESLALLASEPCLRLLSSLIFWDEKRPIKAGILNAVDWSRLGSYKDG